jgi:hypothetical protein
VPRQRLFNSTIGLATRTSPVIIPVVLLYSLLLPLAPLLREYAALTCGIWALVTLQSAKSRGTFCTFASLSYSLQIRGHKPFKLFLITQNGKAAIS